jgi:hypothetical protein
MVASTANIGSDRNDAPQIFQSVTVNGTFTQNGATVQNGAETVNGNSTVNGNVVLGTAGNGLQVKEGTNARMGLGTLSGGTLVVANTSVTANTRIFLTAQSVGGTAGALAVSARTPATSFTVLSTSGTDTSTFAWLLIEPAP